MFSARMLSTEEEIQQFSGNFTMEPNSIKTRKNNGFPFLDILGYLKNTHKNP